MQSKCPIPEKEDIGAIRNNARQYLQKTSLNYTINKNANAETFINVDYQTRCFKGKTADLALILARQLKKFGIYTKVSSTSLSKAS